LKYKIRYETFEVMESPEEYIKSPEHVYDMVKKEFSPIQESMTIIGVNIKNGVIYKKQVGLGTYNILMCKPADLFRPLLIAGCGAFIIVHNHPSGDVTPSKEDIIFTKKVEKAAEYIGVELLDHIIFDSNDFYSFKKNSII